MLILRASTSLRLLCSGLPNVTKPTAPETLVRLCTWRFAVRSSHSAAEAAVLGPQETDGKLNAFVNATSSSASDGTVNTSSSGEIAGDDSALPDFDIFPNFNAMEELGDRIKGLESALTSLEFSPGSHFCIRLDGVSFHCLTKGFVKPFDERLLDAMMFTARDVLEKNHAATMAYVESDEITLLFPSKLLVSEEGKEEGPTAKELTAEAAEAVEDTRAGSVSAGISFERREKLAKKKKKHARWKQAFALGTIDINKLAEYLGYLHPYRGRMFKLVSTTAAYAASRFNYHLDCLLKDVPARSLQEHTKPNSDENANPTMHDRLSPLTEATLERARSHTAMFDSRAFMVPDLATLADCVYWRSAHDCVRNAINSLARTQFSQNQINGKSLRMVIDMLKREKGIDPFSHLPPRALFGTFLKREWYKPPSEKGINPVTGEPFYRTRIKCAPVNWKAWAPEGRSEFAAAKYWPVDGVPGEYPALDAPDLPKFRSINPERSAKRARKPRSSP